MSFKHLPTLWFDGDGAAAVRHRVATGHLLSRRILERCRVVVSKPDHVAFVGAAAALALGEGDPGVAARLASHLLAVDAYPQDLGLGHRGLQLAVAHECCAGLWNAEQVAAIRAAAGAVVDRLRHSTSSHNPADMAMDSRAIPRMRCRTTGGA